MNAFASLHAYIDWGLLVLLVTGAGAFGLDRFLFNL